MPTMMAESKAPKRTGAKRLGMRIYLVYNKLVSQPPP
jgi:hypothetical protein